MQKPGVYAPFQVSDFNALQHHATSEEWRTLIAVLAQVTDKNTGNAGNSDSDENGTGAGGGKSGNGGKGDKGGHYEDWVKVRCLQRMLVMHKAHLWHHFNSEVRPYPKEQHLCLPSVQPLVRSMLCNCQERRDQELRRVLVRVRKTMDIYRRWGLQTRRGIIRDVSDRGLRTQFGKYVWTPNHTDQDGIFRFIGERIRRGYEILMLDEKLAHVVEALAFALPLPLIQTVVADFIA